MGETREGGSMIYRVTVIQRSTLYAPKLLTVLSTSLDTMQAVYDAFMISGVHVRLWEDQKLIQPKRRLTWLWQH